MIFEIFALLCAAGLAVSGSLTFWPVQHGYDFYIPIVLAIAGYAAGIILICLWLSFCCLFVDKNKEYNKISKWAKFWFVQGLYYLNKHSLAIVKVKGKNKLPKNQRFVMVCNHKSKFDSMLISEIFAKYDIAFITKRSNKKIPWGGTLMSGMCYLPIDRDDKLQSLSQFKRAGELIKNNVCSIGVFPEGTRHPEPGLGEFHEGCFNIAIKSGAPLVIFTTKNTDKVNKNFPFKFTKVTIEIVGVIPNEEICDKPAKEVSDMVKKIMEENLSK